MSFYCIETIKKFKLNKVTSEVQCFQLQLMLLPESTIEIPKDLLYMYIDIVIEMSNAGFKWSGTNVASYL